MSDAQPSDAEASSSRGPACDNCRARKVRCDRTTPCSHCTTSRLQCKTTKRVSERRQRISVSGRYDRELENVSGRLASLERMLENFVGRHADNSANASPSTSSGGPTLSTPRDSQVVSRDLDYEGDSSFSAHSKSITQLLETGLKYTSDAAGGDVAAAVTTLKGFLNETPAAVDASVPSQNSFRDVVDYPELSNLTLAPMPVVLNLLRFSKSHPLKYLNDIPNLNPQSLSTICQKIYFTTEEFTIATFITAHVHLYNLFRELSQSEMRALTLGSNERDRIGHICQKNAEIAIRNLRVYMQPTFENIEALVLGSTFAMDLSQSSLAWTLVSMAVRMALDAGYHRLPPFAVAPEVTEKRRIFYFLYCVERGMAINLGRSSSILDIDITTDRPKFPDEVDGHWSQLFDGWFDFARIQGDIYNQLYSAHAQKELVQVKAEQARRLADRLNDVEQRFLFDHSQLPDEPFSEFLKEGLLSVSIVLYSTMCLVYRVIPPTTSNAPAHPLKFCDDAVYYARKAMTTHNEAWDILRTRSKDEWRMFLHWTLLWCPFVPYIVLVGNVIADRNEEDLRLLEKCVNTLHSAAQLSPNVSKLHKACHIFYQIAKTYLSHPAAKSQQSDSQQMVNPSTILPSTMPPTQQQTTFLRDPVGDIDLPDFPLSHEDFNGMLDEWDLGIGAENARQMSAFFEQYMPNGTGAPRSDYILPGAI